MATDFMHACNQVMRGNRDGSFATQTDRRRTLALVDRQLRELGVRRLQLRNLGSRHVAALLARWQQEGLTAGTIKTVCHICAGCRIKSTREALFRVLTHPMVFPHASTSQTKIGAYSSI